jgi:hypothetical protein
LKKISPTLNFPIPLIYYYSFKQDKYIPVKPKYLKILKNALLKHQSQVSPLAVKVIMGMITCFFLGKNFPRFRKLTKGYRTQNFNHKNELIFPPKFEENALKDRIKYYLYHYPALKSVEMLHNISPEEIGIEIKK